MSANKRTRPPEPSLLIACLLALAVVVLMLGLAAGIVAMLSQSHLGLPEQAKPVALLVICIVGGCTLATLLWAAAWLCRTQHGRNLIEEGMLTVQTHAAEAPLTVLQDSDRDAEDEAPVPPPPPPAPAVPVPIGMAPELQQAILEQLKELNANVLLSDAQRQSKRQQVVALELRRLTGQFERALAEGRWPRAQESLDKMIRVCPDSAGLAPLRQRLEQSRSQAQSRDSEQAQMQAQEFMAAGNFDQARAAVERLLERYPASRQAMDLLARVEREHEALVNEQRMRMYKKVETEAGNRHWRAAAAAAQELLTAHPHSPEAKVVRAKLAALRENAQTEEVRELRDRIRDLLARRRYAEALEAARDLLGRFPQAQVAEELRAQMPRLEELAKSADRPGG